MPFSLNLEGIAWLDDNSMSMGGEVYIQEIFSLKYDHECCYCERPYNETIFDDWANRLGLAYEVIYRREDARDRRDTARESDSLVGRGDSEALASL